MTQHCVASKELASTSQAFFPARIRSTCDLLHVCVCFMCCNLSNKTSAELSRHLYISQRVLEPNTKKRRAMQSLGPLQLRHRHLGLKISLSCSHAGCSAVCTLQLQSGAALGHLCGTLVRALREQAGSHVACLCPHFRAGGKTV